MLPFPAGSRAASVGTSMVTAPSPAGAMVAVHTLPVVVSVNADAAPLPTSMSDSSNPVTASVKVNVAVNAVVCGMMEPLISSFGVVAS